MANGAGRGHDVAFDVAAGPQRAEQTAIDVGNGLLEVALENAVQLKALPGGDAQGAVGELPGQVVDGQVLLGRRPCRPGSCSAP